jgi:hypothetical protein
MVQNEGLKRGMDDWRTRDGVWMDEEIEMGMDGWRTRDGYGWMKS